MNINANKLSIAVVSAFLIVWLICSLLVMVMPLSMSNMTGHMLHTMGWHISLIGVLFGGVLWAVVSGATAWLAARNYNRLSHHET